MDSEFATGPLRQAGTRRAHWLHDPDSGRTQASEGMTGLLGLRPNEDWQRLAGDFSLVHPEDRARHRALVESAIRETRGWHAAFRIVRPCDGRIEWLEEIANPVADPRTGKTLIAGAIWDVTGNPQAARSNSRLAAIVESSDDAVISKDLDGVIQTWNTGAERMFGYTAEQAVGRPVTILMPPDRVDEEPGILARIRAGERIDHYETVRQRSDGTLLDVSLSVSPIRDQHGRVVGASKIARDITERKSAERRLGLDAELANALDVGQMTEAMQRTGAVIGRHFAATHCVFREFGSASEGGGGDTHVWTAEGAPALTAEGLALLAEMHSRNLASGGFIAVADTHVDPRVGDGSPAGIRAFVLVPLIREGAPVFMLAVSVDQPRAWRPGEVDLLHDVTQRIWTRVTRMRAEALLKRTHQTFYTLIENLPFGIYVVDSDLRIAVASASARKTFSFPGELIGRDVAEALRSIWNPQFAETAIGHVRHTLATGESYHANNEEQRRDRPGVEAYDWRLERIEMPDGRPGVVCYYYEYTERLDFETRLRESESRFKQADRAKDEFMAMLGHELRNPLSPITTTLSLMKLRAPDTLADERRVIEKQVQYMTGLVDDLLDVSRIARGKLELNPAPVAIDEVVAAAIETSQPLFEEREQTLRTHVQDGLVVEGDARRLVQVLVNLLTNASKYSPRGRSVELAAEADGEQVVLCVRDQGQGIDPSLLEKVFDAFTQAEQALDRTRGGLGLGLAIVRNVVQLHGGTVAAASDGRGRGSEFTVRLPLLERRDRGDDGGTTATAAPLSATGQARSTRVLIVDDYPLAAECLAMLLDALGYATRVVHDGPSALAAVVEYKPSIALVDIGLPVMNGYEVARNVRAMPEFAELPLIAITGYGQATDRARMVEAGFDECLIKPLHGGRVAEAIEKLLVAIAD